MAVPHFSVSIVARGTGRSAVMSAAYRHCAKMDFEREARAVDYRAKQGLLHEEFMVPADAPAWLSSLIADRSVSGASEAFWNRVEVFEKRSDAQLAKDVTIALPIELDAEQNIALVREFVASHLLAKGMVADWVYHDAPGNPHVHLMTTLRPLTEDGFGAKKIQVLAQDGRPLRNDAGKIVYELWAGGADDFNAFRDGWFECQNRHLSLAGLDIRVDGRSYESQGMTAAPTIHLGVGAKAIERKSAASEKQPLLERLELQEVRRRENARRIEHRPEIVLEMIAREKSVFDERDIAKILHRYVDDVELFRSLVSRILQDPRALRLTGERIDFQTGVRTPARYTTRELIRLEAEMVNRASWLARRASHGLSQGVLDTAFYRNPELSDEQKAAIEHLTESASLAAVVGRAGAGKTTMMKAAREVWQAAGYHVVGGALAGKAAEGLENEAGIASRTLSWWERRWAQGSDRLDNRTVFVLDEAGMVSSRQMAFFVDAIVRAGAKLVLVGDPDQLQPIEAGAAFRAIVARIGYAELQTIYRQRTPWMRNASLDLARGRIGEAVDAYRANGRIVGAELKSEAVESLITDWDKEYLPTKTSLILAHLRRDVRMLNGLARARLVERGIVGEGAAFKTADGDRLFSAGDQIVFLRNEASLGVKNGMLGRVVEAAPGRFAASIGEGKHRRDVIVEQRFFNNVDHGYATTIHKSQGATVDRVKVLASLSLDRHLTYVAMTRHRDELAVYYGRRSFAKSGGLVAILSRRNAKETTLDYEAAPLYRQALRFAEARGLHLMSVARTVVRDRLHWIVRQKQTLAGLGARLAEIATSIGLLRGKLEHAASVFGVPAMISAITVFARSVEQAVESRIASDVGLRERWQDVSTRFQLVYAQPEVAFAAAKVDAMLKDASLAAAALQKLASEPQHFGALNGRAGMFASRSDRQDRDTALLNVPALARNLADYIRARTEAERIYEAEENALRSKLAVEIPALSSAAKQALKELRETLDRDDPARLERTSLDPSVRTELERFSTAVSQRFGERTFLGVVAKVPDGEIFASVTAGMTPQQKTEVRLAWDLMRAIQLHSAHDRLAEGLKLSETQRQSQTKGLGLK
ncbi:Ti-type conjugative transfer relaxase TraA [Ensifer adhaerens]|uniref:Ti-type conjugative transfer relaxase TraA n=1 Tax=Ensifer adhaerens TaxID=106592 RepID=UPI00080759EA|nr:Ti-type conjugative transfer relaxase TraA [Ensifer adhaerens]